MNYLDQINAHKYLFLEKVIEENALSIFVVEGKVDKSKSENLNQILEYAPSYEMYPVISDESCKRYKITFKNYITYLVRNETFAVWNDEDEFVGNIIRKYSKSKFWDFVETATSIDCAKAFMDINEYFHIGICCEDHIIDIATAEDWRIEQLT